MSPVEREEEFVERFRVIDDPQERLGAIVGRRVRLEPIGEGERVDAALVPGCASRVWLVGGVVEGVCWFRLEAESQLVRGLASVLAEFCDGAQAADVREFQPRLWEALGLAARLTPTRLNGLASVAARMRALAVESK